MINIYILNLNCLNNILIHKLSILYINRFNIKKI